MDSTVNPERASAQDMLATRADDKLASDYDKVVREELARVQERLGKLGPAVAPDAEGPKIETFRPAAAGEIKVVPDNRPSPNRGALRGLVGFILAAGIAGGAVAWQSPYGDQARQMIAQWAPQFGSKSLPATEQAAPEQAAPPAQPSPSAGQVAAVDPPAAAPQPAPATQSVAQDAPATTAPLPPEVTQLLQTMASDLASLQQGIDQLKTSQDQLARDNARVTEQLKVNQEQMNRLLARVSEQNLHPRPAPPKPAPPHRPVTALPPPPPPPQAMAQPQAAPPLQAEDAGMPLAPRPPKPVP